MGLGSGNTAPVFGKCLVVINTFVDLPPPPPPRSRASGPVENEEVKFSLGFLPLGGGCPAPKLLA